MKKMLLLLMLCMGLLMFAPKAAHASALSVPMSVTPTQNTICQICLYYGGDFDCAGVPIGGTGYCECFGGDQYGCYTDFNCNANGHCGLSEKISPMALVKASTWLSEKTLPDEIGNSEMAKAVRGIQWALSQPLKNGICTKHGVSIQGHIPDGTIGNNHKGIYAVFTRNADLSWDIKISALVNGKAAPKVKFTANHLRVDNEQWALYNGNRVVATGVVAAPVSTQLAMR